ncbi:MAG TPA: hypothetical protein VMZ92_09235 [Planctomycetota bacterium]|nr:hypothetical protein [Planctomycetota bacterium]
MPWTKKSFKKHNKRATSQMASVANALLREGASEGKAIRIANAKGKKSKRRKRNRAGLAAVS